VGDVWQLIIEDGKAVRKEIELNAGEVQCPNCDHRFKPE